ncbi:ABC transporter transmembrane domain-containing protein [Rubrimonas cliftonensis]|uniref:ABC transmembrane type-1 domain-containing protein n=1 Tax=Rubrimonas cliftonensis TaxID=89524 RepID=A0A1H4F3D4_9RHOB|nr:ABC transporter transmembrane domain-containing protein [Rubrimonas cliftonensis]SEA91835.1 hypothetical protein SAMN05444370_11820 [Rubrimonas cliftonensis]
MRRFDRGPLPESIYTLILRRSAAQQVAVILMALLIPPLSVLPLEVQRRIIDDAIPAGDLSLLGLLVLAFAAAMLAAAGVKFAIYYARGLIAAHVARYLRQRVLDAQLRRGEPERARAAGPVTAIVAEEAYPLGGFAAEAINVPLVEGGALLGVFGFMAATEPGLAAIGVGGLALQALMTPLIQQRINRMSARRVKAVRRAAQDIGAGAARGAGRLALGELRLAYRLRLRMNVFKATLKALLSATEKGALMLVLLVGGAMAVRGETTVGVLVAFISGMRQVSGPWDAVLAFYREYSDALVKYRLIREATAPELVLAPDVDPGPAVTLRLP